MDEFEALKIIDDAFSKIEEAAQTRTLQWLAAKYSLKVGPTSGRPAPSGANTNHLGPVSMTAKAAATILNAETGPDLLYAAAAHLAIVSGQEMFSRQALLDTMKTAVGFYKPTYSNNLSAYLDGLCKKGILLEVGTNTFTVKASVLAEMMSKLQQ